MFEKTKLKKKIATAKQTIAMLEQKRSRSQAALLDAFLKNSSPNDEDVDFFNKYTEQIELERNHLKNLLKQFEEAKKQKA